MRKVLEVIWGEWKQKYFCKGDSTQNCPTGKSPRRREPRSCPGRGAAQSRDPYRHLRGRPRLSSAPLRAALRPGNAVAPPEVYQTCLMKECGGSTFRSCPGRGAAPFALLRRAGTQIDTCEMDPGSAAHRCALRCVRGTLWPRRRFIRRV